jgi:SAM-dependent methyltransferase
LQLSFRDPDGFVFRSGSGVFRCVLAHATGNLRAFLASPSAISWMSEGVLAQTTFVDCDSAREWPLELQEPLRSGAILLEHKPIRFPSYPYEWAPEMLHSAGALTLRLAQGALAAGFILKDATPYNVMFDGAKPVFLDVMSFGPRDPLEMVWLPYAQFVQTFVYPLFAHRYFGVRPDEFLLPNRDGLEPERMLQLIPGWRSIAPPFLACVTIPALVSRREGRDSGHAAPRRAKDAGEAQFVLERRIRKTQRLLEKAGGSGRDTPASQYMDSLQNYSLSERTEKERFVADALEHFRPTDVLDAGCNTGHFSRLAARGGARVVAIDRDESVVGALWKSASENNLDILPLVIDIARPPGACGWANREFPSFLDRAQEQFDCVLMLALVHHLLVTERVPLEYIFDLIAGLTTRLAIVEYVDPTDSQFCRIARGRDALHRDLTEAGFEAAAGRRFAIVDSYRITPTRQIYSLRKRL